MLSLKFKCMRNYRKTIKSAERFRECPLTTMKPWDYNNSCNNVGNENTFHMTMLIACKIFTTLSSAMEKPWKLVETNDARGTKFARVATTHFLSSHVSSRGYTWTPEQNKEPTQCVQSRIRQKKERWEEGRRGGITELDRARDAPRISRRSRKWRRSKGGGEEREAGRSTRIRDIVANFTDPRRKSR